MWPQGRQRTYLFQESGNSVDVIVRPCHLTQSLARDDEVIQRFVNQFRRQVQPLLGIQDGDRDVPVLVLVSWREGEIPKERERVSERNCSKSATVAAGSARERVRRRSKGAGRAAREEGSRKRSETVQSGLKDVIVIFHVSYTYTAATISLRFSIHSRRE